MAFKEAKGTALVSWDEMIRQRSQSMKEAEMGSLGGGRFISFKSGQMSYKGSPIKGNAIDTIVLDYIFENAYFEGEYDADNPASPVCYAFAHEGEEKEMAPHPKSKDPQHKTCKGCPNNEFGTADKGRGKACKNIRRLALVPFDAKMTADKILKSEIAFARVPITSVPNWAKYVTGLAEVMKTVPMGMVTNISVEPSAKNQFNVTFEPKVQIKDNSMKSAILQRMQEASSESEILQPYPDFEEKPKGGRGGAAKKPAKRKF